MYDCRPRKLVLPADRLEFAAAPRKYVLHPLAFPGIGQSNDESVATPKHIDRCSVDSARLPTYVREDAEAREPACEQARNSVRDQDVELR